MGAWRELVGNPTTPPLHGYLIQKPLTPIAGGSWRLIDLQLFNILKSKAVRSVFALIFTVGALTVLSASLGGPGHDQLRSSSTQLRASLVPIWSWGTGTLSHAPGDRWDIGVRDHLGAEPEFTLDPQTGVKYPPDINPLRLNGYRRANATFVSLVRNEELVSMMASMRGVEDRVNRKLGVRVLCCLFLLFANASHL